MHNNEQDPVFKSRPLHWRLAILLGGISTRCCRYSPSASLYTLPSISHKAFDIGHFMFKNHLLFPLKLKIVHYSRIFRGIFFFKKKHYYSSIYGAIYGAGQFQDPRHRHLTSDTNYSFSSFEQKEEEYNAIENPSFMSVE